MSAATEVFTPPAVLPDLPEHVEVISTAIHHHPAASVVAAEAPRKKHSDEDVVPGRRMTDAEEKVERERLKARDERTMQGILDGTIYSMVYQFPEIVELHQRGPINLDRETYTMNYGMVIPGAGKKKVVEEKPKEVKPKGFRNRIKRTVNKLKGKNPNAPPITPCRTSVPPIKAYYDMIRKDEERKAAALAAAAGHVNPAAVPKEPNAAAEEVDKADAAEEEEASNVAAAVADADQEVGVAEAAEAQLEHSRRLDESEDEDDQATPLPLPVRLMTEGEATEGGVENPRRDSLEITEIKVTLPAGTPKELQSASGPASPTKNNTFETALPASSRSLGSSIASNSSQKARKQRPAFKVPARNHNAFTR